MTNLTDILANPPKARSCAFGKWVSSLEEKDQLAVKKALVDPNWSASKLTIFLKDAGMTSDREAVSNHKYGRCNICGPI